MSKVSPLKNLSFITMGRMSLVVLQALFYLIFAAILGPEKYGELSYFIAIAGTVSVISRFGLPHTVSIFRAKKQNVEANQTNTLAILLTSLGAIFLLFIDPIIAVLCMSISFVLMYQYELLGLKKYKLHAIVDITKSILVIIIPLLLFLIFDIPGILIGFSIGYLLCSFQFFKKIKFRLDRTFIKKNYKFLLHNFGVDVSSNFPRVADKILIVPILGFTVVGIYQFNLQILFALEMLPILAHGYLLSEISSGKKNQKISRLVILLSVFVVIIVIMLSPGFVKTFYSEYVEGLLALQIIVISLIPVSISAVLTARLQAKESKHVGFSVFIRIGSLFILILTLGQIYGVEGLSYSVLISSSLTAIFLYILVKKVEK